MVYVFYNLSNITSAGNQTTILTFVSGVNDILSGVPALLMLIAIGIILLLILIGRGFDPFRSFAATSFVMMILTIILYPTNLVSGTILIIFCSIFPISMFLLWVWGGESYG